VARVQKIIAKMGVEKALQKKGVMPGDKVSIGALEFNFRPE
jgi:Obg family GTPase CgtA-like protein